MNFDLFFSTKSHTHTFYKGGGKKKNRKGKLSINFINEKMTRNVKREKDKDSNRLLFVLLSFVLERGKGRKKKKKKNFFLYLL